MSMTYKQIAADLGPRLNKLLDDHLNNDGLRDPAKLQEFLWDNKVGILRCLQAFATEDNAAERERCAQVADSMNSTQNIGDRIRNGLGGASETQL